MPLYLVVVDVLMKSSRSFLNLARPAATGERFIEAEGGDQDVRLFVDQRVAVVVETRLTRAQGQLVGRVSQVVDHQLERGKRACSSVSKWL